MDPKKTQPGMPLQFSASFYNRLIDVVKWVETQKSLGSAGQTGMRSNATNVQVKNTSGKQIAAFSVLEVVDRVEEEKDFIWLKTLVGDTPSGCEVPVAITQAPSKDGELVDCVIAGATIARVRVDSLGDRFASPISGETFLGSSYENGAFRILEPLTETGIQRLLVAYHYSIPDECDSSSSSSSGSESFCFTIPGIDMCEIPYAETNDVDFVLAMRDCCLVKIDVPKCDCNSDASGSSESDSSGSGDTGTCGSCCQPTATITIGGVAYNITMNWFDDCIGNAGYKGYAGFVDLPASSAPPCLQDDHLGNCYPDRFSLSVFLICKCPSGPWTLSARYEFDNFYNPIGGYQLCSGGFFPPGKQSANCPIPHTWSGTGTLKSGTANTFNVDCPWTVSVTCAGGPGPDPDPDPQPDPDPGPWPPGDPRPPITEMRLAFGDQTYNMSMYGFENYSPLPNTGVVNGSYQYWSQLETSAIPSQLLDDNVLGGGIPKTLKLTMWLYASSPNADQSGWQAILIYQLFQEDGTCASAGKILDYGQVLGGSANPIGQAWNNTGTTLLRPDVPFNSDISWSLNVTNGAATVRLGGLTAEFVSSDRPATSAVALAGITSLSTAIVADRMLSGAFTLEGVRVAGGAASYSVLSSLSGVTVSSDCSLSITASANFTLAGATVTSSFISNIPE